MSVDSSAYVFDMTKYITSPDKRLQPVDPMGAESFGALHAVRLGSLSHSDSDEVISCAITIPINVMLNIHTEMLMTIGDAAPEFQTIGAFDFGYVAENDFRIYRKLLEVKSVYEKAAKTFRDEALRQQYEYFVMAIDMALKID